MAEPTTDEEGGSGSRRLFGILPVDDLTDSIRLYGEIRNLNQEPAPQPDPPPPIPAPAPSLGSQINAIPPVVLFGVVALLAYLLVRKG